MKYRRALVLAEARSDPGPVLSSLRRVAPELERIVVVARLRGLESWWSGDIGRDLNPHDLDGVNAWRTAAAELAPSTDVRQAPELPGHALVDLALTENVDLLVAGTASLAMARLLVGEARRLGIALLWPAGEMRSTPIEHAFCAATAERSGTAVADFLREHADPSLEVSVFGLEDVPPADLAAAREVLGIRARIHIVPREGLMLGAALSNAARRAPVDLLVLARVSSLLLMGYPWPAPVLMVPPAAASAARSRPLDVTDVAEIAGSLQLRVEESSAVGTLAPAAWAALAFVFQGQVVSTAVTSDSGQVEVPNDAASWLGVVRVVDGTPPDTLTAAEQHFAVLRPTQQPLLVFDAELPSELFETVSAAARASGAEPLAVRLRPTTRASLLRQRLRTAGISRHILDARAILDEGAALDVAEANDPVRLRRAAARMRSAGFLIDSVFHRRLERLEPPGDMLTTMLEGNHVQVELDNAQARSWLLEAINASGHSINLQVYMALDDEVGAAIESALGSAGARGATVRVLVDSLHALHGSFGAENPLLSRLARQPGIELRTSRPLRNLPSLADLKQRDHRKLVVADGRVALIGGRNLSHEYYTSFDEVGLDSATSWRQVPWLDAGARIEGPAVAAIARSFLEAWTEAGGAPFPIEPPAPAGPTPVRVVVHRGLLDARTLEAYLELIEQSRSHIYAVNGFPYLLEIQHALVRALRRGVRVRALTGHLTPLHGQTPFPGPWSNARTTATEFVHSRLDPIIEAGGEVCLFAQPSAPGWEAGLGIVYPHVHAKLMSADGRRCAVGSANLDVTSSYWESELMLVVEETSVATAIERKLDCLMASSTRLNREDPKWRARARRRSWMRRWPGILAP